MNSNEAVLLELIKSSLFGIEPELPEGADRDGVFEEAKAHTVVALTAGAVPKEFSEKWEVSATTSTAVWGFGR